MCSCDLERPDIFEQTQRRAKKTHKCSECGCNILPASKYWSISGLWDGKWGNFKQCLSCEAIADRFMDETDCCYCVGGLYQDLQDSDFLIFDEESQRWESTVEWLRIISQEPLRCIATKTGEEWVELEVVA